MTTSKSERKQQQRSGRCPYCNKNIQENIERGYLLEPEYTSDPTTLFYLDCPFCKESIEVWVEHAFVLNKNKR